MVERCEGKKEEEKRWRKTKGQKGKENEKMGNIVEYKREKNRNEDEMNIRVKNHLREKGRKK